MKALSFLLGSISFVVTIGASANPLNSPLLFQVRSVTPAFFGQPPAPGSKEEKADFAEVFFWQKNRTAAQCASATSEASLFLRTFVGSRTDLLSSREEIRLMKDVSILQLKVTAIAMEMKSRFNRPRPYVSDPKIKPCIPPENSSSFPSGHAANAYAIAEALSFVLPERTDLFMERAQEISLNRLVGGVHFRTDIIAGERIGRLYGRKLLDSKP